MGGGATQVEPGKFVEFESRSMTVTPILLVPVKNRNSERAKGHVPICPHFPIEGNSEESPDTPELTWFWRDHLGGAHSGIFPY